MAFVVLGAVLAASCYGLNSSRETDVLHQLLMDWSLVSSVSYFVEVESLICQDQDSQNNSLVLVLQCFKV